MREPCDYTKWQRSLLADETIAEITDSAMRLQTDEDVTEKKQ
jgi:hypothetical protein